jgi:hypothetical protein
MAALRKNNLAPLRQVCREFTVVCQQLDLFAGALVALDGSKCKAVNAPERPVTPDKLAQLLPQLAQRVEGALQDLDGQENQEDAGPPGGGPRDRSGRRAGPRSTRGVSDAGGPSRRSTHAPPCGGAGRGARGGAPPA